MRALRFYPSRAQSEKQNMQVFKTYLESPLGLLEIKGNENEIQEVGFVFEKGKSDFQIPLILLQCKEELEQYFAGERKIFTVPISQSGTAFQLQVWKELLEIPFGKTTTYLELSKRLKNVGAIRAVGAANGKNQIAIIVPCHRVIGSDGSLTGYAGGLDKKKWLLDHEAKVNGNYLSLF